MSLLSTVVGTCAGSYRNLMGRAVKVGGPAGGLVGMMSDLGAPVANFALYFVIGSAAITTLAGVIWFGRRQRALRIALSDGKITQEELAKATESNGWSVTFAFGLVATLILGLVFIAQALMPKKDDDGPDRGVLATMMPALQKMQDSLFSIEKKVDKIEKVTGETKEQTSRIESKTDLVLSKLDEMSRIFEEASKMKGMVADPKTPAEHYHNARQAEQDGDSAAARKSYGAFLSLGINVIDPCLSYIDTLKVLDGFERASETVNALRKSHDTLSLEAASTQLLPKAARVGALKKLMEREPDFAPAVYLLSQEYSADSLGEQTIADKNEEKALLEKFKAMDAKGQFQPFILDKREVTKWRAGVNARYAKLEAMPAQVLKSPVTITASQDNSGWQISIGMADYKAKSVDYRLDGQGDFQSTGFQSFNNTHTGLPMPVLHVNAGNITPGDHNMEVRYVDMNDKVNGPFKLNFNTDAATLAAAKPIINALSGNWASFREHDGKLLLYFTTVLPYRRSLKTIRYSLDNDTLDKIYPFKPPVPGEQTGSVGDNPIYTEVPATTKSACVQLEFSDGTKTEKKTYQKL